MSIGWSQALAWRVRRHGLDRRVPGDRALELVPRLCGLHAQVMSSAQLTLWARAEDVDPEVVRRALWEERTLVKTWAMRGTLHLLPAHEYPLWQAALSTYQHYLKRTWLKAFETSPEDLERLIAAVRDSLDGRQLTREELAAAVAERTGSQELGEKVMGSWGPFLKPVAFRGGLCFAPDAGRNVRFTGPASWLGEWDPIDPEEALLAVLRRYLGAYGPATREDFARWWAISPAQAGKLIARLGDEAAQVDVEGSARWILAEHAEELADAAPAKTVNLLPGFDQWVVGASRQADAHVAGDSRDRVYRPQGWISPVLLVNGRMDGVWRHERTGKRLTVTIEPFTKLPAWARKGAEAESMRLADHLGGELELSWID